MAPTPRQFCNKLYPAALGQAAAPEPVGVHHAQEPDPTHTFCYIFTVSPTPHAFVVVITVGNMRYDNKDPCAAAHVNLNKEMEMLTRTLLLTSALTLGTVALPAQADTAFSFSIGILPDHVRVVHAPQPTHVYYGNTPHWGRTSHHDHHYRYAHHDHGRHHQKWDRGHDHGRGHDRVHDRRHDHDRGDRRHNDGHR